MLRLLRARLYSEPTATLQIIYRNSIITIDFQRVLLCYYASSQITIDFKRAPRKYKSMCCMKGAGPIKNYFPNEGGRPQSGVYDLTKHAQKRCIERNLSTELVPLIFQYGRHGPLNEGCREWVLDPKYYKPSSRYAPAVVAINDYGIEVVKTAYFVDWRLWLQQHSQQ